ncbi:transmembrane amino acid transporter protein-domain-containing protein [Aspergillus tamarii]|uniref:Transmembrane amino acid transporter protein-domain-containing protein n=1 Tax=Aspergillus tamarii TaxID=41984 RepID=A0A5N6V1Z3_ASPTM|nr:transmembrane amino acid transporter protein-domain-containing protein [Aspergillus tamarii]
MKPEDPESLEPPSKAASVHNITTDAVFGDITEDSPNYRDVGWIGTAALMTKSMLGLGVLSIPNALGVLGLIPGVISLLAIAVIATWSMHIVGVFKINHREVYGIDDVGYKLFGVFGREFLGTAFCVYWIFVSGSGMLSISIALNAISTHGTCTAVFVAVAAILTFLLSSIRTLSRMGWIAWIGLVSILSAIIIVTVAVGVQDRPAAAPQDGIWVSDYELFKKPSFLEAISAVSSMVFAYAGTSGFFAIAAEMREPEHYTRALVVCQSVVTGTYLSIGIVLYYFCGSYVASPALGSAGPLMKKVSYGIGIPGILVSTVIVCHLPSKYTFVRLLRGTEHLAANTPRHWITWLSCTFCATLIAYIIASAIPVFNSLVSLIGAFFGTLMSFQPMGCMWLYDNWSKNKRERTIRWYIMVCWSVFVIAVGFFLMVAGTYGSVVEIIKNYNESGGSAAWSCADNSNSV